MKFDKQDSLIRFKGKPNAVLNISFIAYALMILCGAVLLAIAGQNHAREKVYFYVDFCTAVMLAYFLVKSFRTQPIEKHVTVFRAGIFLLFNAVSMVLLFALEILSFDCAILLSSLLFVLGMTSIILSFNHFIKYINTSYKSAIDLALSDELTGLPNRRHLNLIVREFDKRPGHVCIMDIDHFKRINDTFGHELGDKVLTSVGIILNEFIDENVFIARSGGEEFCIVMSDSVDRKRVVEEIKHAISFRYNNDVRITVSAGVATKRRNENFTSAMIDADEALYQAKSSGRDCVIFVSDKERF
ncbi:GGDEF domain-containing protein [Pantoea sp. KPR_PJ]|uniref:GGDEF domain-containing protein n=1 Tax=Pantoea sp. KPR_PJ TaxID=2738375 RepID=UPI00352917EB